MENKEAMLNLIKSLSKMQGELEHAKKDTKGVHNAKYATLAGCIDTAKALLKENGFAVSQIVDFEGDINFLRTKLLHIDGASIESRMVLNPAKGNDPQALGSAITYARRYSFCAIIGLAADDDDDGNKASEKSPATPAKQVELFKNSALRNDYIKTVIQGINACETEKELEDYSNLHRGKIGEMLQSANDYDIAGAKEITKIKKVKIEQLKENANFEQLKEATKERL